MLIATLYALLVSLIFAGTGIAGKILASYNITPFMVAFSRFTMTVLALLPFITRAELKRVTVRHVGFFFLMGLTAVFLFNVLFFFALRYTSVISVSLIGATNPMIALLASAFMTRIVPSKNKLLALICAFVGVSLIIVHDATPTNTVIMGNNFGEFLAIAAVCSQVAYAMLVKRMSSIFSAIFLACATGIAGLIFLVPFVINSDFFLLCLNMNTSGWLSLLYIGTFGGAVSGSLYIYIIRRMGAAASNLIVFSMAPLFTCILSILLLGAVPSLWHLVGGALVLISLFLGLRRT